MVFRKKSLVKSSKHAENFPELKPLAELAGPWTVSFDPKWGGPESVVFEKHTAVTEEGIVNQMQEARDKCGYGGFGILPFGKDFKPTYLTEDHFRVYGAALKKAKELGMTMCVYDEFGFPSGSAGAMHGDGVRRFANKHPEHTIKRLDKLEQDVTGPAAWSQEIPQGRVMSIVAMEQYTKGVNQLIPHAVWYDDGKVTFKPELSWRHPLYAEGLPQYNKYMSRRPEPNSDEEVPSRFHRVTSRVDTTPRWVVAVVGWARVNHPLCTVPGP